MGSVDEMTIVTRYAPRFDFEKFKSDFAEIVAAMESPEETEIKAISWRTWKEFFSALTFRRAS